MSTKVIVAGVGMVPFAKPGASEPYHVMGAQAARQALADAGLDYGSIQQAFVGYVYGDSTCGQRALYPVGMTGIPSQRRERPSGRERQPCDRIEAFASPYNYAANLWCDMVIDPLETRDTLSLLLELAGRRPSRDTRFGVFRM